MVQRILFALTFLIFSLAGFAQDNKSWTVRINGGAFVSFLNLSLEKKFLKHHSVALYPSFLYFKEKELEYVTGGGGIDYRYYFQNKKITPSGIYAAIGTNFTKGKATNKLLNEKTDVKGFNLTGVIGYQKIFKNRLVVDINSGIQYLHLTINNLRYSGSAFKGYVPALNVGVGYSF